MSWRAFATRPQRSARLVARIGWGFLPSSAISSTPTLGASVVRVLGGRASATGCSDRFDVSTTPYVVGYGDFSDKKNLFRVF